MFILTLHYDYLSDVYSLQNTHRGARKEVTLRTLYDDGLIREGLRISIGPKREPVLKRPQLRTDLQEGAGGIWSIMLWLMGDIGPTLCWELAKGVGDFKASSLAWSVMKRAAGDENFQLLYNLHSKSTFADDLVAPQPNVPWNFDISTMADNPVAVKIYRNLKVYVGFLLIPQTTFRPKADFRTSGNASYRGFLGGRSLCNWRHRGQEPHSQPHSP